jgi:hypothetical protein
MIEILYALLVVALLALLALPGPELQMVLGWVLLGLGLLGGGGAGLVYHAALRAALRRLGRDTAGWLWKPVSLHQHLDEANRRHVLPWFRLGAVGFFVCLIGIALVVAAVIRAAIVL